jgi:hypothetical protein
MNMLRCPVIELRQYTLHPGQRDVLVTLFDRELVESQEALGMTVLGQFRDLDNPDRFVWLRGFETMPARAEALTRFYSGPTWQANRTGANATMVDSDNVLLLRPASAHWGFAAPVTVRPPAGHTEAPTSVLVATIYSRDRPFDDTFLERFEDRTRAAGVKPLACLQTEYAENTFPALPVRTGEHVFVWFARFDSLAQTDAFEDRLREDAMTTAAPERLRLSPTARSLLR